MLQTELNYTNSLDPRQRRHKYFDQPPLQLLFEHLCLEEIFNGDFFSPESASGRQVFKIKTDESEYQTQGTSLRQGYIQK